MGGGGAIEKIDRCEKAVKGVEVEGIEEAYLWKIRHLKCSEVHLRRKIEKWTVA